jgi:hypothetical protein
MNTHTKILFALITTLALGGCASRSSNAPSDGMEEYQKRILEEKKRTEEVLTNAALLSSKSLAVLVRTKQALAQSTMTAEQVRIARAKNNYIPTGMEVKLKRSWDSAPEPLLQILASVAGYRLNFANERPPIPKAVTVSHKSRNIREYISIIEQQTTDYIEIIDIDDLSTDKVITVKYVEF